MSRYLQVPPPQRRRCRDEASPRLLGPRNHAVVASVAEQCVGQSRTGFYLVPILDLMSGGNPSRPECYFAGRGSRRPGTYHTSRATGRRVRIEHIRRWWSRWLSRPLNLWLRTSMSPPSHRGRGDVDDPPRISRRAVQEGGVEIPGAVRVPSRHAMSAGGKVSLRRTNPDKRKLCRIND